MTPEQARTVYRKQRRLTTGQKNSMVSRSAKADARARSFIERHAAGETHQQIADSLGVSQSCVTKAITKYYQRHPHLKKETADA